MRKYFLLLSFYIFSNFINAQDPHFTQSFAGMTYTNPAFAASDTTGFVFISHRNQWPKLPGTKQTTLLGWQIYISDFNGYAGFHYTKIRNSVFTTDRFSFQYSQNIKIKKLLIRPALEFCFFRKSVDWDSLSFGDQIDPRTGFTYPTGDVPRGGTISNIDFNSGLLFNYSHFTLGISAHHLTQPNQALLTGVSFLPLKLGFQFSYDYLINFGSKWRIQFQPYLMYFSQANFETVNYGVNIKLNDYILGYNLKRNDSYALLAGITKFNVRVTYCYEITNSVLGNKNTGGTHEFTLAYRFWKKRAHPKYQSENKSGFESF